MLIAVMLCCFMFMTAGATADDAAVLMASDQAETVSDESVDVLMAEDAAEKEAETELAETEDAVLTTGAEEAADRIAEGYG